MKNIYDYLFSLLEEKTQVALASIVAAEGSTPQVVGASAVFSKEGLLAGTVGGGLLEAFCQKKAAKSLDEKKSILFEFKLEANTPEEDGALCGGRTKIVIEADCEKNIDAFRSLHLSFSKRQPGLLATLIEGYDIDQVNLTRYWIREDEIERSNFREPFSLFKEEIKRAFLESKPGLLMFEKKKQRGEEKEKYIFLEPIYPLPQLVIAGAGHVGQAVAHLGNFLNFEVTVIDDRPELANKIRIPDADHFVIEDIGEAIKNFPISKDTYLVIVTHGHRQDGQALRQCLDSKAAYIGMIGSGRKIELMRQQFLKEGWATKKQWARVYAPIGIDIGSKTVEEIAVSIAAQLILVRSQIQTGRKREK